MRRFLSRYWPLFGIAALGLVVGFYLFKSEAEKERIRQPIITDKALEDGITITDIHYTQDDPDEGMQWVLDAEKVKFSQDRTYFSFRAFQLKLLPEGRPPLELEGKRGDYNKTTGQINLSGDLKGVSANGYRIFSEHLLYDHDEGVLSTNEFVKIIGPFFTVCGTGLFFDLEEEFLRMHSGVTTTITREIQI
jgi:LPS export ABC transporter protein LptC